MPVFVILNPTVLPDVNDPAGGKAAVHRVNAPTTAGALDAYAKALKVAQTTQVFIVDQASIQPFTIQPPAVTYTIAAG